MRYAVVNKVTKKIENIIEAEQNFKFENDMLITVEDANRESSIGMSYVDGMFKTEWEMMSLDEQKTYVKKKIDEDVENKISAGFMYSLDGKIYKFSYDHFDQQNFADAANACIISQQTDIEGLPISIEWNAYDINENDKLTILTLTPDTFLKIYTEALKHKMTHMAEATKLKLSVDKMVTTYELTTLLNKE